MFNEDSDILDEYDFSQAVRGNPHSLVMPPKVRIETRQGDREITIKTVEVNAIVGLDGQLTLQLPADISPGEHRITLLIQEDRNPGRPDSAVRLT